jgi:alpha-beta hydrolase superfamily lysophospholipase
MIAMRPVFSTAAPSRRLPARRPPFRRGRLPGRRLVVLLLGLWLGGCAAHLVPEGPPVTPPARAARAFVMPDGTRLPYRVWRPDDDPWAIVLALHGMNDSRDAWTIPAPAFAAAGIEVVAPDQRGFGATADRAYWPGRRTLVADARTMARLLHAAHPHAKLFLMGESMGAAVLMCLAASPDPPPVAGYVLVSPAVWGRAQMSWFERGGLWVMVHTLPGLTVTGRGLHIRASDNMAALRALVEDPLTLLRTRWDAVNGLVNLMSAAADAAPRLPPDMLIMFGGKDELVPKRAIRAVWRALPPAPARPRIAYYPGAYHLMLRDLGRAVPIGDIVSWMADPRAPLPSGAGAAARAWLGSAEPGTARAGLSR